MGEKTFCCTSLIMLQQSGTHLTLLPTLEDAAETQLETTSGGETHGGVQVLLSNILSPEKTL